MELYGTPHYEVIHRYGYRESLIGRYATKSEAKAAKSAYEASFGERCVIRFREL